MTHLDEGTVHAWLDGALSDAEAKQVSEHAASCAQCGELVAEARGLIAGASRILTSLDDVPAGIAPKRAPAIASTKPRRMWQAAPWVTGIAAALILAIGVKEWRERPSAQAAIDRVRGTEDSLRAVNAERAATVLRSEAPAVDSALRRDQRPLEPLNTQPKAPQVLRQQVAASPPPAPIAAGSSAGARGARSDVAGDLSANKDLKKAAVAEAAPKAAADPAASAAGVMELQATGSVDPELRLAGCYRLEPIVPIAAAASRAKAAVTVDRAQERRLAPTAVAPSVTPTAADFVAPSVLRLDSARSVQGRAVLSAATGQTVGTWRAAGGDSVRLVLLYAGAQTLSTPNRVACPDTSRVRP